MSPEERFERIENAMESLLESDARLSAKLDSLAIRVDALTDNGERQQAQIGEIAAECRDAISRMIDIADGIADSVTAFGRHVVNLDARIRRLENPVPPEAA